MAIKFKTDVLAALREVGYSSTRLRHEKPMGNPMQQLRRGKLVSWKALDTICTLLKCQPGDLLEHTADSAGKESKPGRITAGRCPIRAQSKSYKNPARG